MTAPPRKILIAMDGSKYSDYAFDWYMKYFYKDKDDVLMVTCVEHAAIIPGRAPPSTAGRSSLKEDDADVSGLMSRLQQKIQTAGIKGNVLRVTGGKPGEEIVKAGEENKVDMIIAGQRGIGLVQKTLIGSVSDYVVRNSRVPVLVIRQ